MSFNKKIYFVFTIFLGITLTLGHFIISPFFQEIKQYSQDLLLVRQELVNLQDKSKKYVLVKQEIETLNSDLKKVQALFVKSEMPISFLQFLETLAEQNNILINVSLDSAGFELSIAGSSPDCLKFLEKLEASPYLIGITKLRAARITSSQLSRGKYQELSIGDVEFNLSIETLTNDFSASL